MISKKFEGAHGIYKSSLYFEKVVGGAALVFKFVDPDNYFALELNHNDSGKIRLV